MKTTLQSLVYASGFFLLSGCNMHIPSLLGEQPDGYVKRHSDPYSLKCDTKYLTKTANAAKVGCEEPGEAKAVVVGVKEQGFSNQIQVALRRVEPLPADVELEFRAGGYSSSRFLELRSCAIEPKESDGGDLIFSCPIPPLPNEDAVFILSKITVTNQCRSKSIYESKFSFSDCEGKSNYGMVYINTKPVPTITSRKKEN